MAHLVYRNCNDAFQSLVEGFQSEGESLGVPIVKTTSRNGNVLQITEPMTITYEKPCERVLFNRARDCNPFFHLYESLWMLAGRNDVAPLAFYNSKMTDYSDDGQTFNGAYGYRWRSQRVNFDLDGQTWDDVDQLQVIINHLKQKPDSRRAVLHMSNVEDDLLKMDTTKDQCCNLSVCFSIRETTEPLDKPDPHGVIKNLDMTVFNRSNDAIWGMLGANVVHFSFLQEYVAAHLGVEVGVYNQISNNLHVYEWNFKPDQWLSDTTPNYYAFAENDPRETPLTFKLFSLVHNPAKFDEELPRFVEAFKGVITQDTHRNWEEPFFQYVAAPMLWGFHLHKQRLYDGAITTLRGVCADDWRITGTSWLQRRQHDWNSKNVELGEQKCKMDIPSNPS